MIDRLDFLTILRAVLKVNQTIPILELKRLKSGIYSIFYDKGDGYVLRNLGHTTLEGIEGVEQIVQRAVVKKRIPVGTVIEKVKIIDVMSGKSELVPYNRAVQSVPERIEA